MRTGVTQFLKIKCKDCENEQMVFAKAATKVPCQACGATLAEPRGGNALLLGEVVGEFS